MKGLSTIILEFLMNSSKYEIKDFDLYEAEKEIQPLIQGLIEQYFYLKQLNPNKDDKGFFFIDQQTQM